MGFLDFVSSIGKKLFGSEAEASTVIKKQIEEDNPGMENFQVNVKDGRAVMSGLEVLAVRAGAAVGEERHAAVERPEQGT